MHTTETLFGIKYKMLVDPFKTFILPQLIVIGVTKKLDFNGWKKGHCAVTQKISTNNNLVNEMLTKN